ncbi:MAG: ATP-binding cassette domain-containing protein [Daejeonella sp.]
MNLSSNLIIETNKLSFKFKDEFILNNLNLKIEKGSIYGFLGPNGAGKTTTIRLLLGLLPSKNNTIKLFTEDLSSMNSTKVFSKIGSLIEHPSLYEHLSAWDNLEITRRLRNIDKQRMNEVLEMVNLTNASKKLVKNYSLGMKQRLGLALALISKPELLILDEPINGLDPAGIIEIRELLLSLNKEQGITIFLSSHLLPEIEKLVTHLGILNVSVR